MVKAKIIGKVTHYFDHIGVAVLDLTGKISVGDTVKFTGHNLDFTQTIDSMQVDHQPVDSAKKGDEVAVKTDQLVKEGMEIEAV
jgi:putative protease